MATSGHVGLTVDGVLVEGLVEQMRIAFEVLYLLKQATRLISLIIASQ